MTEKRIGPVMSPVTASGSGLTDWTPIEAPPVGPKGGRPTLFNDLVAQKIVASVRKGNSRTGAAYLAGVGYSTMKRWLADGAKGIEPFAEFARRFNRAMAECEEECAVDVRSGKSGWQGSAWWLERHGWARARWKRPVERTESDVIGQLTQLLGNDARAEEWLLARLEEVRARKDADVPATPVEPERARTSERVQ